MAMYYFPATPSRALLTVVKKRCVHFIGFRDPAHAVKVRDTMNANYPVFLDGAHLQTLSGLDLIVMRAELEELSLTVSEFGMHVCAFEEPDRIIVVRTLLGPGHGSSWSLNHQRLLCKRAYGL
jgi:hypothetical protein